MEAPEAKGNPYHCGSQKMMEELSSLRRNYNKTLSDRVHGQINAFVDMSNLFTHFTSKNKKVFIAFQRKIYNLLPKPLEMSLLLMKKDF